MHSFLSLMVKTFLSLVFTGTIEWLKNTLANPEIASFSTKCPKHFSAFHCLTLISSQQNRIILANYGIAKWTRSIGQKLELLNFWTICLQPERVNIKTLRQYRKLILQRRNLPSPSDQFFRIQILWSLVLSKALQIFRKRAPPLRIEILDPRLDSINDRNLSPVRTCYWRKPPRLISLFCTRTGTQGQGYDSGSRIKTTAGSSRIQGNNTSKMKQTPPPLFA